jgi:hypothetical protein
MPTSQSEWGSGGQARKAKKLTELICRLGEEPLAPWSTQSGQDPVYPCVAPQGFLLSLDVWESSLWASGS